MNDLVTTILTGLVAGFGPAGILGTSHYILKPHRWGRVACYTYGSFWVFCGVSGYLWFFTGSLALVAGAWVVLGLSGLFVAGSYLVDQAQNRAIKESAKDGASSSDL